MGHFKANLNKRKTLLIDILALNVRLMQYGCNKH